MRLFLVIFILIVSAGCTSANERHPARAQTTPVPTSPLPSAELLSDDNVTLAIAANHMVINGTQTKNTPHHDAHMVFNYTFNGSGSVGIECFIEAVHSTCDERVTSNHTFSYHVTGYGFGTLNVRGWELH